MQFELSNEIIDEILFYMEDQDGEFYLDVQEGFVVSSDSDDFDYDDKRFVSIPDWGPSEGFRLMESFTASLRNSVVREKLSAALNRGKGVFRAFKDVISEHPEVEKLWFSYKDRGMKREVIQWYNALREQWGLELIGEEPEDTEDIALEDFRFRDGSEADREAAESLHQFCIDSAKFPLEMSPWTFPGEICIVAESAANEFAAYVSAMCTETNSLHLTALEVKPEYRGLGLGKALLGRLLEQADKRQLSVSMDLPLEAGNFSRALCREHFNPVVTRYKREKN